MAPLDRIREQSRNVSLYSLLLFLVAFPLSVSASQVFAGLSIFFFLFSPREDFSRVRPYLLPWALVLGAYSFVFLSSLAHWSEYSHFWKTFTRQSEAGDFWLAVLFPIAAVHSSREENSKRFRIFLWISFLLVLITGLASVFSEYRLGKFISNGFTPAPGDRRQHPAGPLFGIPTYLPIGLMNTHLTFGGLLSFYLPGLFLLGYQAIQAKNWKRSFGLVILLLLSIWLFLLNQSKSAWLGVFFLLLFFARTRLPKWKELFSKLNWIRVSFLILLLTVSLGSAAFLYKQNWLLQRTISQLTQVQTPENQRYWIYSLSLDLLQKTPILGIGGGRFKEASNKEAEELVVAQEQLWYELYITPNKHAHNDLLQFAIVGGWLSAILWFVFFLLLFREISSNNSDPNSLPLLGVGFIWVAGFFQCYLLDDEVALPFFALSGILWGQGKRESFSWKGIWPGFFFLCITLVLNSGFWFWRLRTPAELAYSRQVFASSRDLERKIESRILPFRSAVSARASALERELNISAAEADSEFSIEGCLTHRYPNPAIRREEPHSFGVYVSPDSKNPPRKMRITVFGEESFDEDKLYWSHRKFDLETREMDLGTGWNRFVWKENSPLASVTLFPQIVYFRSYKIRFSDFAKTEEVQIPVFDFGDLCDF